MPQPCSVCMSPLREEIDRALVAGEPLRNIAERCSVSVTALHRHKTKGHISFELTKAQEAKEIARADSLLDQVRGLSTRAMGILDAAEHAGDLRTALQGIREVRGCLELLAKVTGELNAGTTVNVAIVQSQEWQQIKAAVLETLHQAPELQQEFLKKLDVISCQN